MFSKQTNITIAFFVLFSMLNLTIACNNESSVKSDDNASAVLNPQTVNNSINPTPDSTIDPYPIQVSDNLIVTAITADEFAQDISYYYLSPENGERIYRRLHVSHSMTQYYNFDQQDEFLVGLKMQLAQDTSHITQYAWTPQDSLIGIHQVQGVEKDFELNGETIHLEFSSVSEYERAEWLLTQFDSITILNQSQDDQVLFTTAYEFVEFMNNAGTLIDNPDIETIESIMSNEKVVEQVVILAHQFSFDFMSKVCAVAAIASTVSCSCFAFPPCAVVCVISTPLALACAVMQYFDIID